MDNVGFPLHARIHEYRDPLHASPGQENIWDTVALYLAHHLHVLNPFLLSIRKALNTPDQPLVWFYRQTRDDYADVLACALLMQQFGLMCEVRYKLDSWISMIPIDSQAATRFLTGGWLETVVSADILKTKPEFCATNIKVQLEDGQEAELDAVAGWGETACWIEATTGGAVEERVHKLARLHDSLGIQKENCLLVVSGYEQRVDVSWPVRRLEAFPLWLAERRSCLAV
jgi:hypothetical protein